MSPSLAPYFDVDEGVLVTEVTDPSPGFDAGLRAGDVLVEVAGQRVTTIDEVREAFATSPSNGAGAGVPLRVVRAGSTLELYVPR
jgi:serine protease DegQ